MLRQRLASAAVGIPIIALVVWAGGAAFSVVLGLVLAGALLEYTHAAYGRWQAWAAPGLLGVGLLTAAAHAGGPWPERALVGVVLGSLAFAVARRRTEGAATDWGRLLAGLLYVAWLGSFLILLRGLEHGRDLVFLAVLSTFSTDTFAYVVGRLTGRHLLAPEISPRKTVEGGIGGFGGGIAGVLVLNLWLDTGMTTEDALGLAFLLPLFATVGDLAESLLKRSLHVKDTSPLIPGHGGLLDRLDSVLFTSPLVYFWVTWALR